MASEAVIDISSLIAPISDDSPAGNDIRIDASPNSLYYQIKDARNSARADERKNMYEAESQASEYWRKAFEIAPDILKNEAKDLEIASWYVEALVRLKGFAGLRDGFSLIRQLIELYWNDIYPTPDEDGIETRVAPLAGLNGEGAEGVLIAPIRRVMITEADEPGPFGFWQYQQALDIQKILDEEERSKKISAAGFSLDDIESSVNASSQGFFIDQRDDLSACITEYREITRLLDEHCGAQDAPPSSNIINALEECLGAVKHLGKDKFPVEELEATEDGASEAADGNAEQPHSAAGPIRNREQALKQLLTISEFFRKTEPHSPVSYILEKAVKWGNMSLHELMRELIPDSSSRQYYGSLTGVRTDDDN